MINYEVHANIEESGVLSKGKLYEGLRTYQENVLEIATKIAKESGLTGDKLADEIFNAVEEVPLLSFENSKHKVEVLLSRCRDGEDIPNFDATYLIEYLDFEDALFDGDDFELGQEDALIQKIEALKLV